MVLKLQNMTCWQFPPLRYVNIIFHFQPQELMEIIFWYQSKATEPADLKILYIMRHVTDKLNAIREGWNFCSSWPLEVGMSALAESQFWIKSYHVTSVLNCQSTYFLYVIVAWYDIMILRIKGNNTFEAFDLHWASYFRKHYS